MRSKFSAYAIAFLLVVASSLAITAIVVVADPGDGNGPPHPGFYVDGEAYRTVGTPTDLPDKGPKDGIYAFPEDWKEKGQDLNVAEAKPGDQDYNGGRWEVFAVTLGDCDFEDLELPLTSWEEVQALIDSGCLEVEGPVKTFECPVIPCPSCNDGD